VAACCCCSRVAGSVSDGAELVLTRHNHSTGHGDHFKWLAVLGFVLAVSGVVALPWGGDPDSSATHHARSDVPAFVAEPAVLIQQAATTPPAKPARAAAAGAPTRLVVPRLHVNAPVYPISAPGGVLLPPSNPQTLGWWQDGAVPGAAKGGALITGHTVHTGGGAFDDLETLRAGDRVRVGTAKGSIEYAVTKITIYPKATLARNAQTVFSQDVPGRLVLITCEDWNGSVYLSNTVVLADPLPGA
jgi:LPXTG-site transpeptidase (sortase) family protein